MISTASILATVAVGLGRADTDAVELGRWGYPTAEPTFEPTDEDRLDSDLRTFTSVFEELCKPIVKSCMGDRGCLKNLNMLYHRYPKCAEDMTDSSCADQCDRYSGFLKPALARGCFDEFNRCVRDGECIGLLGFQTSGKLPECGKNEACAEYKECELEYRRTENLTYKIEYFARLEVELNDDHEECEVFVESFTKALQILGEVKPSKVIPKCDDDYDKIVEFIVTFKNEGENVRFLRQVFETTRTNFWRSDLEEYYDINIEYSGFGHGLVASPESKDEGLSGAVIAGIVVGVLVFFGLLAAAIYCFIRGKKEPKSSNFATTDAQDTV